MTAPFKTHKLLDHVNISHGFFGRVGGVSKNHYESLNTGLGSNDKNSNVVLLAVATLVGEVHF